MKTYLEKAIEDISYNELNDWCYSSLNTFSNEKKNLFDYQVTALENAIKILNKYYTSSNSKKELFDMCVLNGMNNESFRVYEYASKKDKENGKINKRFINYSNYYNVKENSDMKYIDGLNFFNRICFWMATASGKTILIIKLIEVLNYLQEKNLISKKDILLLLPREDLISQLKKEIQEYNFGKEKQIDLINLVNYDDDKTTLTLFNNIKVYYYRSDLLRDQKKETILDFKDFYNDGNWYLILDEAHRGEKENSLIQEIVTYMTINGFLFNFSATFTDPIDYATTCFNFNLEKFINAGYGKNLYLSQSYFDFSKDSDEFSENNKQIQVLKSLITFAMVKNSKTNNFYHNPMLVTLVNSVNTNNSDLLMFFKKIEEICSNTLDTNLFNQAKEELIEDFKMNQNYVFGEEVLNIDSDLIKNITIEQLRELVFNSSSSGKIEIIRGEKGKELLLKLETTDTPFGLIKIGATDVFEKKQLGDNYVVSDSYSNKSIFSKINSNKDINLLLGSRSFYEGWDSNRPNIINLINIGGKDAKKFVLQAVGRGIRIEPNKGNRKRLKDGDPNKNILLETLFLFATDKKAIKTIVDTISEQKSSDEVVISLKQNESKFDLLVPVYSNYENKKDISKFNLSENSYNRLKEYFTSFSYPILLLKYNLDLDIYNYLCLNFEKENNLFQFKNEIVYNDMDDLLTKVISHLNIKDKKVTNLSLINDQIIHFKHIGISNLDKEDFNTLIQKINNIINYENIDESKLLNEYSQGKITKDEFMNKMSSKPEEEFKGLKLKKLSEYYYIPMIYSKDENISFIKNIIKVPSEVMFCENLCDYITNNKINFEWMFSRINESVDNLYIPYYSKIENKYNKFCPDFIFWLNDGKKYKIIFIDPKGTKYTDYENKVDGFEKMFHENGEPIIFKHNGYEISFDLKLITDDINKISEKYKNYWLSTTDFDWFKI